MNHVRSDPKLTSLVEYFDRVRDPYANAWVLNVLLCTPEEAEGEEGRNSEDPLPLAVSPHVDETLGIRSKDSFMAHVVRGDTRALCDCLLMSLFLQECFAITKKYCTKIWRVTISVQVRTGKVSDLNGVGYLFALWRTLSGWESKLGAVPSITVCKWDVAYCPIDILRTLLYLSSGTLGVKNANDIGSRDWSFVP